MKNTPDIPHGAIDWSTIEPKPEDKEFYDELYADLQKSGCWFVKFDDIKWMDRIGSGAFGEIYKAEVCKDTRAVKILKLHTSNLEEM